jgi:phosphate transport system substrate-binding protein
MHRTLTMAGVVTVVAGVAACNGGSPLETRGEAASAVPDHLTGTVTLDGSSTVLPVSGAIAQAFESDHPAVKVNVHESGTGGGFRNSVRAKSTSPAHRVPSTRQRSRNARRPA